MQRFENAPWDVRLMLADHGFDPLLGALAACKLCDAFLRFAGGIGIDLETGLAVQGGDWRNEGPNALDVRKHVVVRAVETGGGRYHLRTWGLCKFLRAELEVRELPFELVEGARSLLTEAAEQAAKGALYHEGDYVGTPRQPLMLISSRDQSEDSGTREAYELVDVIAGREPVQSGAERGIRALMHIGKGSGATANDQFVRMDEQKATASRNDATVAPAQRRRARRVVAFGSSRIAQKPCDDGRHLALGKDCLAAPGGRSCSGAHPRGRHGARARLAVP
jgi:hypothetical protein